MGMFFAGGVGDGQRGLPFTEEVGDGPPAQMEDVSRHGAEG